MDPREWLFDRRIVSRNLNKGVLSEKDYKEYLKNVSDTNDEHEIIDVYGNHEDPESIDDNEVVVKEEDPSDQKE